MGEQMYPLTHVQYIVLNKHQIPFPWERGKGVVAYSKI